MPVLASDDFSHDSIGDLWDVSGTVEEAGGRLRLLCTSSYSYALTGYDFPLNGLRVEVELPVTPESHFSLETGLRLETVQGDPAQEWIVIGRSADSLVMDQRKNYESDQAVIDYDAEAHRWLALEITSATVYWSTSPDGQGWTARRSAPQTVSENNARARLECGYWGSPGELDTAYGEFASFIAEGSRASSGRQLTPLSRRNRIVNP